MSKIKYHLTLLFLFCIFSCTITVQAEDPSGEIMFSVREDPDYNFAKFSVSVRNTGTGSYEFKIALWNNHTQMVRDTEMNIAPSQGLVEIDFGTHPCGLFDNGVEVRLLSTDGSRVLARAEGGTLSCGPLDGGAEGRKCNEICGDGLLGLDVCDENECRLDSNNAGLNCWGHKVNARVTRVNFVLTVCSSCAILEGDCRRYSDLTSSTNSPVGLNDKIRVCEADDCGLDCKWDEMNRECVAVEGSDESREVFSFFDDLAASMGQMACTSFCLVTYLAVSVAVLYMLVAGFKYMTSGTDESARMEAKTRIIHIFVGLIVLAIAYPVVQYLFADTEIGFYKCKCGDFIIGETGPGGRVPTDDEKNFGTDIPCTDSVTCTNELSNYFFCSRTGKCFGKRGKREDCDIKWEINNLNKVCYPGYSCTSGVCQKDVTSTMGCTDHSECKSGKYCRMDAAVGTTYCADKKGIDSSCIASESVDGNPDKVCASDWCVGGKCVSQGNCDNTNDCTRHDPWDYCGTDWKCRSKIMNGEECDDSMVADGYANLVCRSEFCDVRGEVEPRRPGRCQDKP